MIHTFNGPRPNRVRHEAGEIAWANVLNPLEDRETKGKFRPVVIVAADGGCDYAVGLTTRPTRVTNGTRRISITLPGLASPSYVWSDRLVRVSRADFGQHVGWINEDHLLVLMSAVRIPGHLRHGFQLGVYRHREARV